MADRSYSVAKIDSYQSGERKFVSIEAKALQSGFVRKPIKSLQ